jgi:mgtE-like transporter
VPLRGLLGPDPVAARQSLAALAISSVAAVGAGLVLSSLDDTYVEFPGLLVLVPAAIGIRGNIFGALGSRLSTAIHTGTFSLSRRPDTVVGQNVLAASALTLGSALFVAVAAWLTAAAFSLAGDVSFGDLIVVSVIGGVLASAVVLVVTLALAGASARYGWDLDNVNAPLVSAVGDVVTVPALFLATLLAGRGVFTAAMDLLVAAAAAAGIVAGWRSSRPVLRVIVRESVPILAVTSVILAVAGVVIEGRFEDFAAQPALLILVPAALSGAGAVGSILSARLSTKLHLGLIHPAPVPGRAARADIATTLAIALPLFALSGLLAEGAALLAGREGPGLATMVGVSLMGGMLATAVVVVIAYYGTVAATRMRVDPDSYGIPVVTSVVDLVGAYTLVLAIAVLATP